jgi:hypothetical protein
MGSKRIPLENVMPPSSIQYLIYFFEGQTYSILPAVSTLLPQNFNHRDAKVKDNILLRGGIAAKIIKISDNKKELTDAQILLENKLCASGSKVFDASQDSLGFLDNNVSTDGEEIDPRAQLFGNAVDDSETMSNNDVSVQLKDSVAPKDLSNENLVKQVQKSNSYLREIKTLLVENNKYQKRILQSSKSNTIAVVEDLNAVQPVMFGETNLVTLGHRNLDCNNYSLLVARKLWTDDEIKSHMIGKKRAGGAGRPEFSPTKTGLFNEAIKRRFNLEDDG